MKPRFILAQLGFDTVSTVMASILVAYDVVLSGSFLMSFLLIPIWFLGAIIKAAIQRPGWILSMKRIVIPLLIGGIVCGNAWLQNSIAQSRFEVVIKLASNIKRTKATTRASSEIWFPHTCTVCQGRSIALCLENSTILQAPEI